MSNEINFILTNSATELIPKVLNGKTLNFTRMAVGDGFSYNTEIAKGYKTLVNEVLSLDITKKEILSPSSIKITSAFKSTDAQKEFYYREVGLYAQDPDTGQEVLYAYGNRNDAAELITPTGANIVTKQLIFIVSVGDSANVTFNVNADVYALQEDMLDVQANKANKNLSNTGMITNCLLEVPQRIKYELIDGMLTIKAGSVVIIPYGIEDKTSEFSVGSTFLHENFKVYDTQFTDGKFFVWAELQNDVLQRNTTTDKNIRFVVLNIQGNNISTNQGSISGENPTTSETWRVVYNIALNLVGSNTGDTTITYSEVKSFPLMLSQADGSVMHSSIIQVFNGIGYIGSTIWVDKGVKGLIPNGRNPDGTLNNIEWEQSSICVRTFANSETYDVILGLNGDAISRLNYAGKFNHNEDDNITYTNGVPWYYSYSGTFKLTAGVISNLKIYQPFQAVNRYSDKPWLSSLSMPSEKYENLTLGENGSKYVAPANGWYSIRKVTGIANGGFSFTVRDSMDTEELYRVTTKNPIATDEVAVIVPVLKGQNVVVGYDATGETIYFRFIYAEGEVN